MVWLHSPRGPFTWQAEVSWFSLPSIPLGRGRKRSFLLAVDGGHVSQAGIEEKWKATRANAVCSGPWGEGEPSEA